MAPNNSRVGPGNKTNYLEGNVQLSGVNVRGRGRGPIKGARVEPSLVYIPLYHNGGQIFWYSWAAEDLKS